LKETQGKSTFRPGRVIVWTVVFGLLFLLGAALLVLSLWYRMTYDIEFKELIYTLSSPLKGTGDSTIDLIFSSCLPWVCGAVVVYVAVAIFLVQKGWGYRLTRRIGALFCVLLLLGSMGFSLYAFRIPAYLKALSEKTTIYEDYYVDPDTVSITANGETKNLIYIYLESMETTYASKAAGGKQPIFNYMPNLTQLAKDEISFTDKADDSLGGFHTTNGTTWTMAALLSTTSGIPFSFPLGENGHNKMSQREYFAAGLTTLGDILEEKGYRQEFLCGSNATFGGRRSYFEQHGSYEIFDLYTAREEGYIASDYHDGFWGYEDFILYEIAKDELTELAAGDKPFNFTMLTVDTHHVDGNRCEKCGYTYGKKLENVVNCADRQLSEFLKWCQEQDFYEDSVIIITGDHPRMDTTLIHGTSYYERTIYNAFLNTAVQPVEGTTTGRVWTSYDMFPTTLAAMGFEIEGNRLGLGVNMFSGERTLAEELGYDHLNAEVSKFSDYYIREFS
jgi:phosphoglycerol transferase